jgi:hypothetical protein
VSSCRLTSRSCTRSRNASNRFAEAVGYSRRPLP